MFTKMYTKDELVKLDTDTMLNLAHDARKGQQYLTAMLEILREQIASRTASVLN
jgi:hypothetical protein